MRRSKTLQVSKKTTNALATAEPLITGWSVNTHRAFPLANKIVFLQAPCKPSSTSRSVTWMPVVRLRSLIQRTAALQFSVRKAKMKRIRTIHCGFPAIAAERNNCEVNGGGTQV
jgi:hypothetical protein